jgi:hypothetical protein
MEFALLKISSNVSASGVPAWVTTIDAHTIRTANRIDAACFMTLPFLITNQGLNVIALKEKGSNLIC